MESIKVKPHLQQKGETHDDTHALDRGNTHHSLLVDAEMNLKMITRLALMASRSFFNGVDEAKELGQIPGEVKRLFALTHAQDMGPYQSQIGELDATLNGEC